MYMYLVTFMIVATFVNIDINFLQPYNQKLCQLQRKPLSSIIARFTALQVIAQKLLRGFITIDHIDLYQP